MLAISFGFCVFSSLLWLFYSIAFVVEKTDGLGLFEVPLSDFAINIALIILPIFLIWTIFGYVMQYFANRRLNKNLYALFQQMKKNQDYTDVVARLILESERQTKDGFVIDKIDILIADLNEILSEIIYKTKIASKEQIDMLWQKAQNGGKWAFAKVIIEVWQNQTNFLTRVLDKAQHDVVLSGSILEFCARYLSLVMLLEKHDKDKVFLNLIEAGVLGKVFAIFAPLDDEIKKRRGMDEVKEILEPKEKVVEGIKKDDFSLALERSFGDDEIQEIKEVVQSVPEIKTEVIIEPTTTTQDIIEATKKDWEELQNFTIKLNDIEEKVEGEPDFEISMGEEISTENDINIFDQKNEDILKKEENDKKEDEEVKAYPFGNWM